MPFTWLVINGLGGGHTHTHIHQRLWTKWFQETRCTQACGLRAPGLKTIEVYSLLCICGYSIGSEIESESFRKLGPIFLFRIEHCQSTMNSYFTCTTLILFSRNNSKLRGLKSANAHEAHTRIIVWLDVKINFEFKRGVQMAIKVKIQ